MPSSRSKEGRFSETLLGKRVDYSGHSVIVVGPSRRIDNVSRKTEPLLSILFSFFLVSGGLQLGASPNLKILYDHT
uniref:Uncharacterized protein n=1 Tax=Kalanchoe fedtschenkoi TaxID=63787 RepID=A0A7N0V0A6_KALFE